jgi:regulator of sirC expression with transglutaminase-like and TPR domain
VIRELQLQNSRAISESGGGGVLHGAAFSDLVLYRMLKEMSFVGSQLEQGISADWVTKRIQFMSYELRAEAPSQASAFDLCHTLNTYFFGVKEFATLSPRSTEKESFQSLLLHRVLSSRVGSPVVLSVIYSYLGAQVGLKLEFVDLRPTCFLKFMVDGVSHYIDLGARGRVLSSGEMLDLLHDRFHMTAIPREALLEPVSVARFMTEYLSMLKSEYVRRAELDGLLMIQNALLGHQPSSLSLLAERALLYRRLGHFKQALADLKRYFSFHEKETAPIEVLSVFNELTELVERQKTSIDIVE